MKDKKDYIDEHDDWQTRQFLPGYFVGGRIPIWLKKPGNRKRFGFLLIIGGLIYGGSAVYNFYQSVIGDLLIERIMSAVFLGFAALVFVLVGIGMFRKSKK